LAICEFGDESRAIKQGFTVLYSCFQHNIVNSSKDIKIMVVIFIQETVYAINVHFVYFFFQVSLATFATFIFASSDHYLDAQKAFVAISLFNILRFAINFAPMAITETIKVNIDPFPITVVLLSYGTFVSVKMTISLKICDVINAFNCSTTSFYGKGYYMTTHKCFGWMQDHSYRERLFYVQSSNELLQLSLNLISFSSPQG